jgi:hypothetical protein
MTEIDVVEDVKTNTVRMDSQSGGLDTVTKRRVEVDALHHLVAESQLPGPHIQLGIHAVQLLLMMVPRGGGFGSCK